MSKAVEFNSWCITVGVDFRQFMFIKDPTLPKATNPDFDPVLPESSSNPREIYQPKDLTGYGAKMTINNESGDELAALEDGAGITIVGVDGSLEFFIDNTVTKVTPFPEAVGEDAPYDLFLIPPSGGDIIPLTKGTIKIEGTITDV